jgi:hypothetical protein
MLRFTQPQVSGTRFQGLDNSLTPNPYNLKPQNSGGIF